MREQEEDRQERQYKGVLVRLYAMGDQISRDPLKCKWGFFFWMKVSWNTSTTTTFPCLKISHGVIKFLAFLGSTCLCTNQASIVSDKALGAIRKDIYMAELDHCQGVWDESEFPQNCPLQLCWNQKWLWSWDTFHQRHLFFRRWGVNIVFHTCSHRNCGGLTLSKNLSDTLLKRQRRWPKRKS